MKRVYFCIALLFLCFFLFSSRLIRFGLQAIVKIKTDCELSYRNWKWEDGRFVLLDADLFQNAFRIHVQKASLRLDWSSFPKKLKGHLTIDSPRLSILEHKSFSQSQSGWFDLSYSVNDGLLDWGGQVRFSAEHNTDSSRLNMCWEDGSFALTIVEGKVETVFDQFKIGLLAPWVPCLEIQEGVLSGRLMLSLDGKPISANLRLLNGSAAFSNGSADSLQITLSYNSGLGAKWDCKGFGKIQEFCFPFTWTGRGFFKNFWFESEIRFSEAFCKILSDETSVALECASILPFEANWLQAACAPFLPESTSFAMTSGSISGRASLSGSSWSAHLVGEGIGIEKGEHRFFCQKASADLTQEGGSFILADDAYELKFAGMWDDWNAEASISGVELLLHGSWDGEKVSMEIEKGFFGDLQFQGVGLVDPFLNASFLVEGSWEFLQKKIPFYCPIRLEEGKIWSFDVRGKRKTWDFFRLNLIYDGKEIVYLPNSHILGQPLASSACSKNGIDLSVHLPWNAISSASSFLNDLNIDLKKCPRVENVEIFFQYNEGAVDLKAKAADPPFVFHAHQNENEWSFRLDSDLKLQADLKKDGNIKGFGKWKSAFQTRFEGKIGPSFELGFSLSETSLDLKAIEGMELEGIASGGGHFIYNGEMDADLDFSLSNLSFFDQSLENQGQIHLSYQTQRGVLMQGLHLHGKFDCVVDLLEYDARKERWILHNAQIHAPALLFKDQFLGFLDPKLDLNFTADLDLASDFSTLSCKMQEASIPFWSAYHHIDRLHFLWNDDGCEIEFRYLDHLLRFDLQIEDQIKGRLTIGEEKKPLKIDWEYRDLVLIQSIEGSFKGFEASFHAESPNRLVGSAYLDFKTLAPILPRDVAEVFEKIQMGQGYELKGKLQIENRLPYFEGILSGKGIELFGFQFRTLFAQINIAPTALRIYDIKISDHAGIMKIDEILMKDESPWTIAIPNLSIYELRPSLLVRPGGKAGSVDPLVVRELKIYDFKGILSDGNSYTAKGDLHFINSFKREETVFDIPANVLSRIVGLDLDLLIPVTGDLTFNIKDGYFNLLELANAYSEGKRSEFFLESDPPSRMDLNGNLQIFIKMKQFVLLKITESMIISVDGVLDDPKYRLKKKRFFGLIVD